MLQSILLAVDRSPFSRVAAAYANYLAVELGAVLHAVHVDDTRLAEVGYYRAEGLGATMAGAASLSAHESRQGKRRNDNLLRPVRVRAMADGVSCHVRVLSGVPAREVLSVAENSDLIVLGRHGESWVAGSKRLGEVVNTVLRRATQPVLLAGTEFESFRRVLLGFDGGKAARGIMLYAMELAQRLTLPIMAVSVNANESKARHQLDIVEHFADAHGLQVTTCIGSGHPVETLLGMAQADDLLTIGAFGEGRLHQWLAGSTTATILQSAPQAVLLHR
ncbi:universal stress protein [Halomonas sp. TRM85114]|uniref:universal stress protein n=1 Tax=Halomonas jincaotanensis TaxID=2810616 RepID=UPI001BD3717D|nr:universal stress protein [Halomonas jincaotanensis]MBS9405518.1 universal stress protein [Halomonas jincaotanensis]